MKMHTTFILAPIAMAVAFATSVFFDFLRKGAGVFQAILVVLAALVAMWIVATIFNFAIFAPVYWLLGRNSKGVGSNKSSRRS